MIRFARFSASLILMTHRSGNGGFECWWLSFYRKRTYFCSRKTFEWRVSFGDARHTYPNPCASPSNGPCGFSYLPRSSGRFYCKALVAIWCSSVLVSKLKYNFICWPNGVVLAECVAKRPRERSATCDRVRHATLHTAFAIAQTAQ